MLVAYWVFIVLIGYCLTAQAQIQLKRQVLSSFGSSSVLDTSVYLGFTGGQGHPVGSIISPNIPSLYLRRGFEQPSQINSDCGILVSFIEEPFSDICGTRYSFEYTGATIPGMTFLWSFGPLAIPSSSTEPNPAGIVFTNDIDQYIIRLTVIGEDGCSQSASRIISVSGDGFITQSSVDSLDCADRSFSVSVETINGSGPFSIIWSDGVNMEFERNNLAEGMASYTVSDSNGCADSDTLDLTGLFEEISIDANIKNANCDTSILGSIEIELSGGMSPFSILWNNESTNRVLDPIFPGTYTVTVTDDRGCLKSQEFLVGIDCLDEKDLPNTFTPNGDGVNDSWRIPGIEDYPNNELEIFNRWGSPIYKANPYQNDWTGTNMENEDLPLGAYYYVLELNDNQGTTLSGSITIVR